VWRHQVNDQVNDGDGDDNDDDDVDTVNAASLLYVDRYLK